MFSDDLDKAFSHLCTRKRRSSYRDKKSPSFTFWGLNVIKEVAQTGNRKGYFRKNVWHDAAFQLQN